MQVVIVKKGSNEFEVIQAMTQGLIKHDLGKKSETAGERQFCNMAKAALERKLRQVIHW